MKRVGTVETVSLAGRAAHFTRCTDEQCLLVTWMFVRTARRGACKGVERVARQHRSHTREAARAEKDLGLGEQVLARNSSVSAAKSVNFVVVCVPAVSRDSRLFLAVDACCVCAFVLQFLVLKVVLRNKSGK